MKQTITSPHHSDSSSLPNESQLQDKDVINLLDYIEVLAFNWRMIMKTTITAAIISIVISLCLPNIYNATARILPPQQDSSGLMGMLMSTTGGIGGVAADLFGKGSSADLYVGILNSEAVSDKIIDGFKLLEVYDKKYRIDAYNKLDKNVDISVGKKDGIISISVEDVEPKRAADIANAYVSELDKILTRMNITGAGQNRQFYEQRLAKARSDLSQAENNLKLFQLKNKALDITEQAKGTIKGVADLEAQLALEEVKLAGLRQFFTDNSQEIKAQLTTVTNIRKHISKFEGNRSASAIPGVGSVPELGQQYLRLMREFKIQETIVEMLTKQLELAKLTESRNNTNIQIIQTANPSDKKTKPKRAFIVIAITIATCFITIFYILVCKTIEQMSPEEQQQWIRIKKMLPKLSS